MAEGIRAFLNTQELSSLGQLTLQSRYVVEGSLAGRHRSPNRGSSSEFAEHRAYQIGDELKHLDWKVLGRTDKYFIRRYEDETNLRVYLLVDRSASMKYGLGAQRKFEFACKLAAAIGYVVVQAQDSVGLCVYSKGIDVMTGTRNSVTHLNDTLKLLQQQKPAGTTETADALHRVADSIRRRAMVVIFSDLLDEPEEVIRALAHFRKQHHDVIIFNTLHPDEIDFPFRKGAEFVDLETDERLQTDPKGLVKSYQEIFSQFLERYRKGCSEMNIDYRLTRTSERLDHFVRAYLEERRRLSR